jgi:4-hydroxybenzoate polyprenyltransferase
MNENKWLVIDLDDTLIRTDLFVEGLLRAVLTRPFALVGWLIACRFSIPGLKQIIAEKMPINLSTLPYNQKIIAEIQKARNADRPVMLATAAAEQNAQRISEHLGLFDCVIASSNTINLKGEAKRDRILEKIADGTFEYTCDSMSDLPVVQSASRGLLINPSSRFLRACTQNKLNTEIFDDSRKSIWEYDSKILRPHQWMKNIVFFMPAITSFGLYDLNNLWLVFPTFSIMSLIASVVYILNDIADIESDRSHQTKRNRCFATGEVSVKFGVFTALILLFLATIVLLVWQPSTWVLFTVYFILTVAYTMVLKEFAILDIFILVSFYLIRILIGIETLGVSYSLWFISFCFLLFGNLAFLKRFIEVNNPDNGENERRKYDCRDKEFLRTSGIAAIFASVVLLLIYSKSLDFSEFYSNKDLFSVICIPYSILMLRMWYLASRNEVDSDPLVYIIRSPLSYFAVFISGVILYCSR